jgi:hypothetical protein
LLAFKLYSTIFAPVCINRHTITSKIQTTYLVKSQGLIIARSAVISKISAEKLRTYPKSVRAGCVIVQSVVTHPSLHYLWDIIARDRPYGALEGNVRLNILPPAGLDSTQI